MTLIMASYLHTLETWNPPYRQPQPQACDRMQQQFDDKRIRRILRHIYKESAIDTRYTCIPFSPDPHDPLFGNAEDGKWLRPGTAERNRVYREVSEKASVFLAQKTLAASSHGPADVTHVITASCTGFSNPGPDFHIIEQLGLSPQVQRYHLGFMGCYAAFPALRLADEICRNRSDALVMIQCLELCSLHVQTDPENKEAMVAAALFADGAGCALVSGSPPESGCRAFRLDAFASTLVSDGVNEMAWTIGDRGFDIVLSGYVPRILGDNIAGTVIPFLREQNHQLDEIQHWAVHPGGKSILDRVGEALELAPDHLTLSREILRKYGNMSSATMLFLLKGLLSTPAEGPIAAMAFGPGLTVEMGLLSPVTGEGS